MNKERGIVGIMVSDTKQRKFVLKKYLQCNTTRMKLFCFTPSSINWQRKRITGLHQVNRKWVESTFRFPDIIYNRCYNSDNELVKRLEEVIGANRSFNHINQFNKLETHLNLSRWLSSHLPETVPYDKESSIHLLMQHKLLYFKPCHGHHGKGVYRVDMRDSGEIFIGSHHFLPSIIVGSVHEFQDRIDQLIGDTPYLIQRGVPIAQLNGRNFDMRVLVQKNEKGLWAVTNMISRIAFLGCFNTSICEDVCLTVEALKKLYPPDKVRQILTSIYNISMRAAEIIELDTGNHLCELSVDLALDHNGDVWIIEVNGKPQKDLYDDIRKQARIVYSRPLQYARHLYKQ